MWEYVIIALRRIFGPQRVEVTVEWTKLHNRELNNLRFLTLVFRVMRSRRGWAEVVERIG
jgi:hypothetical protein